MSSHPRGVPPGALHLIGYSVGAHIAGLVANYINKGKLGRITGEKARHVIVSAFSNVIKYVPMWRTVLNIIYELHH